MYSQQKTKNPVEEDARADFYTNYGDDVLDSPSHHVPHSVRNFSSLSQDEEEVPQPNFKPMTFRSHENEVICGRIPPKLSKAYRVHASYTYGDIARNAPIFEHDHTNCSKCITYKERGFQDRSHCYYCGRKNEVVGHHCMSCGVDPTCKRCGSMCNGWCTSGIKYVSDKIISLSQREADELRPSLPIGVKISACSIKLQDIVQDDLRVPSKWHGMHHLVRMHFFMHALSALLEDDPALAVCFAQRCRKASDAYLNSVIMPQGEVMDQLGHLVKVLGHVVSNFDLLDTACMIFVALSAAFTALMELPVGMMLGSLPDLLMKSVNQVFGPKVDNKELYGALARTLGLAIMRAFLGFPAKFVVYDSILDLLSSASMLLSASQHMLNSILISMSKGEEQSIADPITYLLGTILFVGTCATGFKLKTFSDIHQSIRICNDFVPKSLVDFTNSFPVISNIFGTDKETAMKEAYPQTHAYIDWYAKFGTEIRPPAVMVRDGQVLYRRYLAEIRHYDDDASHYFRSKMKLLQKPKWLDYNMARRRPQPHVICLHGRPGVGKSHITDTLLDVVYESIRRLGNKWYPGLTRDEVSFSVSAGGKHYDGYRGQPVLLFDDWLSPKEVPGASAAEKFLKAVNIAPWIPEMAALEDKGLYAEPMFVILTTNIPWEQWPSKLQATNNPEAYFRRISEYYDCVPIEYDAKNGMLVPNKSLGEFQHNFLRHDDRTDLARVTGQYGIATICRNVAAAAINFTKQFDLCQYAACSDMVSSVVSDAFDGTELSQKHVDLQQSMIDGKSTIEETEDTLRLWEVIPVEQQIDIVDTFGECSPSYSHRMRKFFASLATPKVVLQDMFYYSPKSPKRLEKRSDEELSEWFEFLEVAKESKLFEVSGFDFETGEFEGKPFEQCVPYHTTSEVRDMVKELTNDAADQRWCWKAFAGMAVVTAGAAALAYIAFSPKTDSDSIVADGMDYVKTPVEHDGAKVTVLVPKNSVLEPQSLDALFKHKQALVDPTFRKALLGNDEIVGDMLPAIQKSVVKISLGDERTVIHGFLINSCDILTAAHLIPQLNDKLGVFHMNRWFQFANDLNYKDFCYVVDSASDVALIRISRPFQGARKHVNKFPIDKEHLVQDGQVLRIRPEDLEKGSLSGFIWAEYGGNRHLAVGVDIKGQRGLCGCPYMLTNSTIHDRLLGIHTSGVGDKSYFSPVSQTTITVLQTRMSSVRPSASLNCEPVKGFLAEAVEKFTEGPVEGQKDGIKCFGTRKSKLIKIPELCNEGMWSLEYDIAKLTNCERDGVEVPIECGRWEKQAKANAKKRGNRFYPSAGAQARFLAHLKKTKATDWLPDPQEAIKSSDSMNSMSRGKSSGPKFLGSKRIVTDPFKEEPHLDAYGLDYYMWLLKNHQDGETPAPVFGEMVKDEKLPKEKIEANKTRTYTGGDVGDYLMDRVFFWSLIDNISKHGKELHLKSGFDRFSLGRDVSDFKSEFVVESDVATQDYSHSWAIWLFVFKSFIESGWWNNDVGERTSVDPNLPLLDSVNRIRYQRWRDTFFCYIVNGNVLRMSGGLLPSGSLLTTIMNLMCQLLTFCEFKELCNEQIDFMAFGDDSWLLGNKRQLEKAIPHWIAAGAKLGFTLKGTDLDDRFHIVKLKEAKFCGRQFVDSHDVPVMVLEPKRLVKSVQFTQKGRIFEIFPSQISTFIQEAIWHEPTVFADLVNGLKVDGFALVDFLDFDIFNLVPTEDLFSAGDPSLESRLRRGAQQWLNAWTQKYDLDVIQTEMQMDLEPPPVGDGIHEQDEGSLGATSTDEGLAKIISSSARSTSESTPSDKLESWSFAPKEVEQYWMRPTRVASLAWTTTDAAGTELWEAPFPSTLLDAAANHRMKLANTFGFMTDIEITLVINANQFQAGAVVLCGAPGARAIAGTAEQKIQQACSGPSAVALTGQGGSASIKIPYTRDLLYSVVSSYGGATERTLFDFVRAYIFVLSPLKVGTGTSTTANIQVYVQCLNARVQQGTVTSFSVDPQAYVKAKDTDSTHFSRKTDRVDSNIEAVGNVIETVAGVTSRVVSSVAKTAATVSALAVGLSKEVEPEATTSVSLVRGRNMPNYDGYDNSVNMGIVSSARNVPPRGLFPQKTGDPMMIKQIASRRGYLFKANYTIASTTDQSLARWIVTPMLVNNTGVNTSPSPMGYIASHFAWWRGDITYELKVVKTSVHTGTLCVMYDYNNLVDVTSASRTVNLHRVIWDLKLQDTLRITCPYRHPAHYRPAVWHEPNEVAGGLPTVILKAMQPLISNDTVADSLEIVVFGWCNNLEVGMPSLSHTVVEPGLVRKSEIANKEAALKCINKNAKKKNRFPKEKEEEEDCMPRRIGLPFSKLPVFRAEPQSMFSLLGANDPITNGPFDGMDHQVAEHVILGPDGGRGPDDGEFQARVIACEKIDSVRQVIKRFEFIQINTLPNTNQQPLWTNQFYGGTMFESLAELFCWSTGGMRLKLAYGEGLPTPGGIVVAQMHYNSQGMTPTFKSGTATAMATRSDIAVLELNLPNTSPWFFYLLNEDGNDDFKRPPYVVHGIPATVNQYEFLAAADDMSWGGINYVPVCSLTTNAMVYDSDTVLP